MIVDRDYQAAASVDLTGLYEIRAFRVDLDDDIRRLDLEGLGVGNVGGKESFLFADHFFKFLVKGFHLFLGHAAFFKQPLYIRLGEFQWFRRFFGFFQHLEDIVMDVNFKVKPGQTVGIIGSTGAGKSTIMNLLCRFYDTTSGEVLVDGVNVRDMDLYNLRDNIGMAMQDVFLFSDTIEGNIAYGRPNCSFEEVKQAAIMADANHFIQALSDGYDTIVGERGVGLSGGQKQRISLARALLKDPSILILDDTTSAVDMETESYIQSQLKKLDNKCTIFVIAYRISSIRDADLILVMDNGRIIEQGTHEQLVAAGGYYATAFHNQYGEIPQEILNGKGEK